MEAVEIAQVKNSKHQNEGSGIQSWLCSQQGQVSDYMNGTSKASIDNSAKVVNLDR